MPNRPYSIIDYIIGTLMGGMILLVFVPIISRTFFGYSIVWADEMARVSMIWIVYLGMVVCYRYREHIAIDILYNMVPNVIKWIFSLITELIMLFISIVMVFTSISLTRTSFVVMLPATEFPVAIMTLPLLIGSIIMIVYILISIFKLFKDGIHVDQVKADNK